MPEFQHSKLLGRENKCYLLSNTDLWSECLKTLNAAFFPRDTKKYHSIFFKRQIYK